MRHHIHNIYKHYFTNRYAYKYSLYDNAYIPFAIGCVLAFFTIGLDFIEIIGIPLPTLLFSLGLIGFILSITAHILLKTLGSFHSRGLTQTIKTTIFLSGLGLGLFIYIGISLYGGIIISGILFLFIFPFHTITMPLNITAFVIGSIWWYSKGLRLVDGEHPRHIFETEKSLITSRLP